MLINEGVYLDEERVFLIFPLHSLYGDKILNEEPKEYQTLDLQVFYK